MWPLLISSLLGEMGSQQSEQAQQYILKKAYDTYGKIDIPSIQNVIAQEVGPTQMENVQANPELAGLERQSLDQIMNVAKTGGHTLADDVAMARVRGQLGRQNQAAQQQVAENMAQRGLRGGGAELAMNLANNQAMGQRASDEGMQIAAEQQKRALDAIMQGGRLASQMRGTEFSEASQRAQAADARARYNAEARARAQQYNAGLPQQHFANRMAIASGQTGVGNTMANFYGNQGANRRAAMYGYGQAANAAMRQNPYNQTQDQEGYTPSESTLTLGNPQGSNPDEWENPYGGYGNG